jgi:hypothetical protein
MRKIVIICSVSFMTLSFCVFKLKKDNTGYTLAFVKEIYIDKGSEMDNNKGETVYTQGDGKRIENFLGIFPKNNDTITIYKLKNNNTEKLEKFSFWSKKEIKNNRIVFYCSLGDAVKVVFTKNKIIVDNDIYIVNNEYFKFLKQKVFNEGSILDLVFFLKDGYGDYAQSLESLNKNWRNQKENSTHKIVSVKIRNRDYQTDDQFFEYKIDYRYKKDGELQSISGEGRYNKDFVEENKKYIKYSIEDGKNERSSSNEDLYKNKKTLFDSISGSWIQNSTVRTSYFTKYQSKLEFIDVVKKPKDIEEVIKLLKIKREELE